MIQFYKPNAKNTGAACSFWFNPEHECFYTNIIQQASWNAKARTGSFKANLENPTKFIKIKLNINEIGGILDCLDRGREWKCYHNYPQAEHITKASFKRYNDKDGVPAGYSLSALKEPKDDPSKKTSIMCPFNFGEARALRECLIFMMNSLFTDKADKIKANTQSKKQAPKNWKSPSIPEAPTIQTGDDEVVF